MGARHQVNQVARTTTVAGVSNDAILLLETKADELVKRVMVLEQENSALLRQNRGLAMENQDLQARLQRTEVKGSKLDPTAGDILKFLFRSPGSFTSAQICHKFQISMAVGLRHIDLLCDNDLISVSPLGAVADGAIEYGITSKGRAYCVELGWSP